MLAVTFSLWHGRGPCRRGSQTRKIRRAAAARAPRASSSATSAASRSGASASSSIRSSAAGAKSSASATPRSRRPESIKFPAGKKAGGVLTLLVDGAHAPLIQHLDADDRRSGQPLLRLCGDQPHRVPAGQAARAGAASPSGRSCGRCPRSLAKGLREIADPELRACLESLAAQIAASSGPPSLSQEGDDPIPAINRSK